MRTIPPRQRNVLARRIAAGQSPFAAARGSGLPAEDVAGLMHEPEFHELIGAWGDIFDLTSEARTERLTRLAHMVMEHRLASDCGRTAAFVLREARRRRRDPVVTLARGFSQLVEMEQERAGQQPPPEPPPSPSAADAHLDRVIAGLEGIEAAVARAHAAARLRARPDRDDAMLWRKASALRQEMLSEQLLFSATSAEIEAERRKVPLELHEVDAIEAAQVAAFAARQAAEAAVEEAAAGETDEAFEARAIEALNATLAQAPPHLQGLLASFSQDELWALVESCWPKDQAEGTAQPQGP
ncbi:MAG TPA: hypothetical protein PKA09_15425 [Geminicoccus sp.]|nr:hypothetical protein [Geminicoccus sp.]